MEKERFRQLHPPFFPPLLASCSFFRSPELFFFSFSFVLSSVLAVSVSYSRSFGSLSFIFHSRRICICLRFLSLLFLTSFPSPFHLYPLPCFVLCIPPQWSYMSSSMYSRLFLLYISIFHVLISVRISFQVREVMCRLLIFPWVYISVKHQAV